VDAGADPRGWPIPMSIMKGKERVVGKLRGLADTASLLTVAIGALGVGLLTGNKRRGINFFTSNWPRLVLATNRVNLNVIGEENLTGERPAVFIFNHRNNFDSIMVAALVRDNWTGVGKKELENNPITAAVGKVLDVAYIVVAPEGTRHDTVEVGAFKKGPFRIAMSAKIPIVPIVIRNAEAVAARDSATMTRGAVDVAVFPPVSVKDWTVGDLPDRIAAIRQLYLDTLKDWPGEQALITRATAAAQTVRKNGGGHGDDAATTKIENGAPSTPTDGEAGAGARTVLETPPKR
jgi:putative phosphoserine phosphatase/1-acylglycerol-3-phosphate O-acyltransferase